MSRTLIWHRLKLLPAIGGMGVRIYLFVTVRMPPTNHLAQLPAVRWEKVHPIFSAIGENYACQFTPYRRPLPLELPLLRTPAYAAVAPSSKLGIQRIFSFCHRGYHPRLLSINHRGAAITLDTFNQSSRLSPGVSPAVVSKREKCAKEMVRTRQSIKYTAVH